MRLRNDTGIETQHSLALDYGSGETESAGRMIYGPFEVPAGATHRVVASEWPAVEEVRSEIDLDRDGEPDQVEMVRGRALPALEDLGAEADLSVDLEREPETFSQGVPGEYELVVRNDGPNGSTSIVLDTAIKGSAKVEMVSTSHGACDAAAERVRCDLGALAMGETATIRYDSTPAAGRAPTQVAMVFGAQGDPNWTNNSVTSSATAALTEGDTRGGGRADVDADGGGSSGCGVQTRNGHTPSGFGVLVTLAILIVNRRRRAPKWR